MKWPGLLVALTLLLAPISAEAEGPALYDSRWVTLGTQGGPVPRASRSQPANLLVDGGHAYLVDVGDGAAGQLAKVGITPNDVEAVFISHLHFDHTAGLAAILGLRWQSNAQNRLKIFGPPGTAAMVEGLVASMVPGTTAGYGVPGAPQPDLRKQFEVMEMRDGATFELDEMTVRVRSNTHYSFSPGSDLAARFEALSLRFDLPDRSIVYTGDTGPSRAVEELAEGADLLVAEMMDVEFTIANLGLDLAKVDPRMAAAMERHLREHHLLPSDVGQLAERAGVKSVVVTHFVGEEVDSPRHFEYLRQVGEHYRGPVAIADDLDGF